MVLSIHAHDIIRMAVANVRHIIDAIQDLVAILLVQKLSLSIEDLKWMVRVVQSKHGVQRFLSLLYNLIHFSLVLFS